VRQAMEPERVATTELVQFRLIPMACCGTILCWVNPRWPTFCPQCGERVYPTVKQWVTVHDPEAVLEVRPKN
jgi:hypothetical protein